VKWRLLALLALLLPELPMDPFRGGLPPSWAHPLGTDLLGRDGVVRLFVGSMRSAGFASACALGALILAFLMALTAPRIRPYLSGLRRIPALLILLPLASATGPFGWPGLGLLLAVLLALHLAPPLALQVQALRRGPAWKNELLLGASRLSRLRRWAPWGWERAALLFPSAWLGALWAEATLRALGLGPGPGTDTLGRLLQEELPRLATDPTPLGGAALGAVLVLAWTSMPEIP
jgi:peptide/nickel transport system permease protein